jgi:GH25 family lysozyme M1 (1,4-beta-N-acetylmuramidase)
MAGPNRASGRHSPGILGKSAVSHGPAVAKAPPTARGAAPGAKPKGGKPAAPPKPKVVPAVVPAWVKKYAKGIDITTQYRTAKNPLFDWHTLADAREFTFRKGMKVQDPISFVILKATYAAEVAPYFKENWSELGTKYRKVMRGAYAYITFSEKSDPIAQANAYLTAVGSFNDTLPPILDVEHDSAAALKFLGITRTETDGPDGKKHTKLQFDPKQRKAGVKKAVADVDAWIKHVQSQTKRAPIIYTTISYWRDILENPTQFKDYPLWIASYPRKITEEEDPNPHKSIGGWETWTFWQISGSSKDVDFGQNVPGIGKGIDVNLYNGNALNLYLRFNQGPLLPSLFKPLF